MEFGRNFWLSKPMIELGLNVWISKQTIELDSNFWIFKNSMEHVRNFFYIQMCISKANVLSCLSTVEPAGELFCFLGCLGPFSKAGCAVAVYVLMSGGAIYSDFLFTVKI